MVGGNRMAPPLVSEVNSASASCEVACKHATERSDRAIGLRGVKEFATPNFHHLCLVLMLSPQCSVRFEYSLLQDVQDTLLWGDMVT